MLLAGGAVATAVQRVLPIRLPLQREGPWTVINARAGDDSRRREELGVTFRPAAEAIEDTVHWLYQAGHISARQAGRAARPMTSPYSSATP